MNRQPVAVLGVSVLAAVVLALSACVPPPSTPTPLVRPQTNSTPVQSVDQSQTPTPVDTAPTSTGGAFAQLPSLAPIINIAKPAVVAVFVQGTARSFFLQPVPTEGTGSGVIIDRQGHVITNNHVLEGANQISVQLPDGRSFSGKVVGRDPLSDLAVLQISGDNLPLAKLGDSNAMQVGDWVIAIGNALALEGGPTVTVGVVSALARSIEEPSGVTLHDMIQTDAAINPGNSGGPLINLKGEVVGINTAVFDQTQAQGIGFSIAIASAKPIVEALVQTGRYVRPQLGVGGAALRGLNAGQKRSLGVPVDQGVVVTSVDPGSQAGKAGLQANDVITAVDGRAVNSVPTLQLLLWQHRPGDTVEITYYRGSDKRSVKVTLGERPAEG